MAFAFTRTGTGTGDYIACGTAAALNPSGDFSLACWVNFNTRPNELGQSNGYTAQFLVARDGSSTNRCYSLVLQGFNATAHTLGGAVFKNNTTATDIYGTTVAAINTWYHVCLTYKYVTDGTSELRVYVNGTQEASSTTAVGPPNQATVSTDIGRRAGASQYPINGRLAEVGIWNATLTASQAASLAKGFACDRVAPQSLVLYAPLVRDLIDIRGTSLTNNGPAVAYPHPRVYV